MARFVSKGDWKDTTSWLRRMRAMVVLKIVEHYAQEGAELLKEATPKRTGFTSESWSYEITNEDGKFIITWTNSNVVDEWAQIAVLLNDGHGTGTGGYVEARNYIDPTIQPILDKIANLIWKEVGVGVG